MEAQAQYKTTIQIMNFPHKFLFFPRVFCFCWKKHDTSRDLTRRTETSWRKLLLHPVTQSREAAASQQLCAALGLGVRHQMQMAQSTTTAAECTKPSRSTRSAQHNVIESFHLFILNCPVEHICLFSKNNAEFGLYVSRWIRTKAIFVPTAT